MSTARKNTAGGKRTAPPAKRSSGRSGGRSGTRSGARSTSSGARKKSAPPPPKPIRRGVGALICLLLAIFAALGYFRVQALFIDFFCGLVRGLIGYGFYLLPPALLGASAILTFHRGRPVRTRLWCTLLLPVVLGALFHLLLVKDWPAWDGKLLQTLWTQGEALHSGGALSGLAAMAFSAIFSKIGAGILFVLTTALLLMGALNITLVDIIDYLRSRPEYEEEEIPERPKRAQKSAPPAAARPSTAPARAAAGRRSAIDIPVDDGPDVPPPPPKENQFSGLFQKKGSFFNRKSAVPAPDQVLAGVGDAEAAAPAVSEEAAAPIVSVEVQPDTQATLLPPESHVPRIPKPEPVTLPDDGAEDLPQEEGTPLENSALPPDELEEVPPEAELDLPFQRLLKGKERPVPEGMQIVREPAPETVIPEIVREPAVSRPEPPKPQETKPEQMVAQLHQDLQHGLDGGEGEAYQYPPVDLLHQSSAVSATDMAGELQTNQIRLADAIHSFNIDANIVDIVRGPSVTRYELELAQGVRMNKLTNLMDDIALALGATGVRIAPIPDKISMVGIEVPNKLVTPVGIRDVIDSKEFRESPSKVSFAVGKDITNHCVVCDISKLPHLLIAGTTGSGKSVCTNSLIISLLYKATPEEVRLIMVDPKMVELGIYNGIPHLLIPVVTDPKKAAGALQWAVTEMMKRYRMFAEVGVRDLASYNAKAAKTEGMDTMPQVVVVIDELADLMLVAAKEVEESICRVAQMGRAAGMHLVIATQRPSADVITGLMKANIPSRIAFAVASAMESRIILDTQGAEKLVGRGDMLYFPLGSGKPTRVQGCLISDQEVAAVVDYVKQNSGSAQYDDQVMQEIEQHAAEKDKASKGVGGSSPVDGEEEYDELINSAIEVVLETGQASVSMLQRRLKLGYARAARLVDQMEEKGVVGPFEGSKPRQVLITKAQWQEMRYRQDMSVGAPPASEPVPDALEFERDAIEQGPPPF